MDDIRFKINLPGLNELMKSKEMQDALLDAGKVVAQSAGSDYEAEVHKANWIAISNVYPNSKDAAHENFKHNTLLKAIGTAGLPMEK